MYPTPNYGWRKQSKRIFDSDRRFELRRIRDIRVGDIEGRLYSPCVVFNDNVDDVDASEDDVLDDGLGGGGRGGDRCCDCRSTPEVPGYRQFA